MCTETIKIRNDHDIACKVKVYCLLSYGNFSVAQGHCYGKSHNRISHRKKNIIFIYSEITTNIEAV